MGSNPGSYSAPRTPDKTLRPIRPILSPQLASELGDLFEIHEVSQFLSKMRKLTCQNRISLSRATALTFIANSLLTSFRLLNTEDRIAVKDPENLRIDWTGVPRPDRDRALIRAQQPIADSTTPLTLLSL